MEAHYRQIATNAVGFPPSQPRYGTTPQPYAAQMSPPPAGARVPSGVATFDGVALPINPTRRGSSTAVPHPLPTPVHHNGEDNFEAGTDEGPGGSAGVSLSAEAHQHGHISGGLASATSGLKPIRRRMRMITSCLECRRRKLKCNKNQPCTNCVKFQRECLYLGPKLDEASQLRLTEIKEKVGSLERQLERDVAKGTAGSRNTNGGSLQQRILADDVEGETDEDRDLQITPMVAGDLTYEDLPDGGGAYDVCDLGVRVGKMRITERIGGLNRPRISEEIQAGIANSPASTPTSNAWTGGSSQPSGPDGLSDEPCEGLPDFLKPGESYLPPTSGFFFGQSGVSPPLLQLLPGVELGNRLADRYLTAVHPIAPCVHRPSFEVLYRAFWEEISLNYEPSASVQAVVFAAWFSAAVSLDEVTAQQHYGHTKAEIVAHMKIATETALSKANFLRTTRVETMQAFVMYMIPLCRDEVSRAHSVLVGAAVRMAECMGLHRDGEAYGLSPLETHIRRLIWHQLCFLDIRTCEAQGPKPAIRREDYDTKLPLNCDESDFAPNMGHVPAQAEKWTSTLFALMRFELNEMMRCIWADRRKLEMHKTTLTAVLSKIENFRKRMMEKYGRYLDDRVPIQKYARLVMQLLLYRLHAMVLHPYHSNANQPLPERLNGLLVTSGVLIIEIAIQLESNPLFRDWAWYLGAYQQYQIALLLATEIYYRPQNKECNRIWRCLDYVFSLDANEPRDQKSIKILREIANRTKVYMGMRKVRAPTGIARAVPLKQAVKESPPPPPQPQLQGPLPAFSPQVPQHVHHMGQQQQQHAMKIEPDLSQGVGVGAVPPVGMPPLQSLSSARRPSQHPVPSTLAGHPNHMVSPHQQPVVTPNMVYAGVSNGEVLWGFPPMINAGSPENSSDGGSVVGQPQRHGSIAGLPAGAGGGGTNVFDGLDWVSLLSVIVLLFSPSSLYICCSCLSSF
ncbi:fungal-specific transcription factor domain-containing protein [Podospora australis]|uniref:Fungal-specific transcription factor domain-containing protein n=1 Tax=Podospora australis TaxID=1536484 RepID=A0AAN6X473_9PEZI|nr:fungal-specific transcription factor domain-containing protein [Podospora australis]